jgi:hypothetical protein
MSTTPELDDAEKAALAAELKRTIAADPFPMSPRIHKLRAILAKLEPPPSRPKPYPPPKPAGTPSLLLSEEATSRGRR